MELTASQLIDKLISNWAAWDSHEEYYLTVLSPSIVRMDGSAQLDKKERAVVEQLRQLLSAEEWGRLPEFIADSHNGKAINLASDRERRKKLRDAQRRKIQQEEEERAEEERRRLKIAREQARKELVQRQAKEARAARMTALLGRMQHVLLTDFFSATRALSADPDAELLSNQQFRALKTEFVRKWAGSNLPWELAREQAAAIAETESDVQVIARAGSGKTRTLVSRAIFLQEHCRVSQREILLLAFNKKAANEMRGRLSEKSGEDIPHVMTFHALAHALVHPDEDLIFDDPSADQFSRSREVQEVIDEHLRSEDHRQIIRDLMLAHFREDWERIVDGRFHFTMDEFLDHRRSLPRETLNGDYVKSFGEKVIANALFEHGVEYKYERNFRWSGVNYRPDFTIATGSDTGVVIEYFGLQRDSDYDEMSDQKRAFWAAREGWTFIEFAPKDLASKGEQVFVQLLLGRIQTAGIPYSRRTDEEIWKLVRSRALDRFTKAMTSFIGRARKQNLSVDDLSSLIDGHSASSSAEKLFLGVGLSIYRGYLSHLEAEKKYDFDGLIWRSASLVRNGQTRFARDRGRERGDLAQLRFVMIDEFQDFSPMFFELIDAVRSANPKVRFFCVGDDWQAINGFAGSDLRYFSNFTTYFPAASKYHILENYRSRRAVVEAGNSLMWGRGRGSKCAKMITDDEGWLHVCNMDDFQPTAAEKSRHSGDEITPALLRLTKSFMGRGLNVVILSRRNHVGWYFGPGNSTSRTLERFIEHIRSYLPEEDRTRVAISTVHGYKGLDRSAVVVLDAINGSFPLVHPNWVFNRIFGDSIQQIHDEERRLFYVAITRAKESLALVTATPTHSPYLDDMNSHSALAPLKWADLPPVASLDEPRLEIRVFDAYDVKDRLKALDYRWDATQKCWYRTVSAVNFSFDALTREEWVHPENRIEVYSEGGDLLHQR